MAGMNEKEPFEAYLRESFPVKPPSDGLLDRLEKKVRHAPQTRSGPGSFLIAAGLALAMTVTLVLFFHSSSSTPLILPSPTGREAPRAIPLPTPPVIHVVQADKPADSTETGSTFYSDLLARREPSFSLDLGIAPSLARDPQDVL